MNIFFRELKSYRKSMSIWSLSLSALVIVFLLMFPAFTSDVTASQKMLLGLPAVVREALGISFKNFFTIYGFFAYLFTFAALAGAVQAMNLGVGVLSKEISGKTADFLLTKPVSRKKVYVSKLAASVCVIVITNIVFSLVTLITAKLVATSNFNYWIILLISGSMLLIQLFFIGFGILLSVIIPKVKSVISVSLPTVFAFYIVGTLGAVLGNENIQYITPFKFYDPTYIIDHISYNPKFVIIEFVLLIFAIIFSYAVFNKKDIHAAS